MIKALLNQLARPVVRSSRPAVCENIRERADLHGWTVAKIQEPLAMSLNRSRPETVKEDRRRELETHSRLELPAQYLMALPEGAIASGMAWLSSGECLKESDWRMKYFLGSDSSRIRFYRHKLDLDGDCYYPDILFSGNYAHWFADDLPRLLAALPWLPSTTRFVLNEPVPGFKLESLAALGISPQRLVRVPGYCRVRCERLWYATPAEDMAWNPRLIDEIRTLLLSKFSAAPSPKTPRIFLSRGRMSTRRRLVNEDELLPLIESFGFRVVIPEQLSLQQQVQAFSGCAALLGPHGAGLTNLLFMPRPAELWELQDDRFAPRVWYWKWAAMLGQSYDTLAGPVVESTDWLNTSFSISPDELKRFFDLKLSGA